MKMIDKSIVAVLLLLALFLISLSFDGIRTTEELNSEKVISELPETLQVPYLKEKYGRPIFLLIGFEPHLFIWKDFSTKMVKKNIFDYMVENRQGNSIRTCLYGAWIGGYPHVLHPFKKIGGIYQLPDPEKLELYLSEDERMAEVEKYINLKWKRRILKNTKNAILRGITVILDFNTVWYDWKRFWLNPSKCNRDLWYTVAGQWHYYEYWNMKGGEKIRRTGLIIENFERYMRNELLKMAKLHNRKEFVVFSAGNENHAGYFWHKRKSEIFEAPLYRKMTSIFFHSFYYKAIHYYFMYNVHRIGSLQNYMEMEQEFAENGLGGLSWLPSCDGALPSWPKRYEVRNIVYQSLKDKNLGYELLHAMWEYEGMDLTKWDWDSVWWMTKGFKKWRREQQKE